MLSADLIQELDVHEKKVSICARVLDEMEAPGHQLDAKAYVAAMKEWSAANTALIKLRAELADWLTLQFSSTEITNA